MNPKFSSSSSRSCNRSLANDSIIKKDSASKEYLIKQLKEFTDVICKDKDLFFENADNKKKLSKNFLSICLLGVTGHGKSSTANSITNSEHFKISEGTQSETENVKGLVTTWRNDPKKPNIIVLDTPGFGDTKGLDTTHIANIALRLKVIGYVHTFLLIFNSEDPRFDEQLQSTLKIISQMFGVGYLKNVLICFTKFGTDKRAENARKNGKKPTQVLLIKEFKSWFNKIFSYDLNDDQFVFLNNTVEFDQDAEENELRNQANALRDIRKFTEERAEEPFFCKDIQEVMTEKDALQKKILQINAEAEKEKEIFVKNFEEKLKKAIEKERAIAKEKEEKLKEEAAKKEEIRRKQAAQREEEIRQEAERNERRLREEIAQMERRRNEEAMRMFNYQNTQALYRDFDNMIFRNVRRKKSSSISSSSSSSDGNDYHPKNNSFYPSGSNMCKKGLTQFEKIFINQNDNGLSEFAQNLIKPKTSTFDQPFYKRNSYDDDLTLLEKSLLSDARLKKDGTPDMRYKINRKDGYNKDDSIDKRFKN